jgi:hypothetical protein
MGFLPEKVRHKAVEVSTFKNAIFRPIKWAQPGDWGQSQKHPDGRSPGVLSP